MILSENVKARDGTTIVINLRDAHDSAKYGGKAAGLALLINGGLPVQPGIAIAEDESPSGIDILHALMLACRSIKFTLHSTWAVRSSAIGEDGSNASFAGQHDSYLNVESWEIHSALTKVRGSLHNKRADSYRRVRSLEKTGMGVVVQRMVPNVRYSAIMFTKHPLEDDGSMYVEYSPCLGDKLVSGEVTPESVAIPREFKLRDWLNYGPKIDQLAEYGMKVESILGCPADIEAAYNGEWWLCQARPITTLE